MDSAERKVALSPHDLSLDLDIAKRKLAAEQLSLVVVKQRKPIFTSEAPGVRGLVDALKECRSSLVGAAVADKVVGKAAALLCAYAEFSRVYACVMSELGSSVLKRFSIPFEHESLVPNILNRYGSGMCPFERLVLNIDSPKEAYFAVDSYLRTMTSRGI